MCYSAQIAAEHKKYERELGVTIDIQRYVELYWDKANGAPVKTPKAMDDAFLAPRNADEQSIRDAVLAHRAEQATALQQEMFAQAKRLADAERKLRTKPTKAATESQRIARTKIDRAKARMADLTRTELLDRDSRIFPGVYAHVLVMEEGRRVLKPMRYQCRPCGKPAAYDRKYPGTYNARRDNLEGFWRGQFGVTHGIVVMDAFFENVARHAVEGRELGHDEVEQSVVLEFHAQSRRPMFAACLWSHWQSPGQPDLLSFAAITDEPPPEIAAAGHDRCIIPIKPENIDAWLDPRQRLADMHALLDDRDRPYYEHRLAA